jgi:beta-glucosidase
VQLSDSQRSELRSRADKLLASLTTGQKIALLHQYSPGVPELGIAPFRTGTEALHGAAWLGTATVFPQAVGLGASWDPGLVTEIGAAVGNEVRALHRSDPSVSLNVWAPVVNLLRDPRWGRNEEGYSEDPLLTATLATAFCTGLRGDHPVFLRTAPLLKHFLAYNNETCRDTTSSVIRPRVLHEYELPPFRGPIEAGVAVGVMPSYNLVNGRPNHVSPYLADLVRTWTKDDLIVCSDATAPSNLVETERYFDSHPAGHAAALRAGLDSFTDHGPDSTVVTARLTEALSQGLITVSDIDQAARRLLVLRLRLGEFDPAADPYAGLPEHVIDSPQHRDLALRAARASIVLLRNDGLLPLAGGQRVTVVGPFADTLREDWYSGTMPYQVTVADGLREALAGAGGAVTAVEEGSDRVLLTSGEAGPELGVFDVFDWGGGVITLRSAAGGGYLSVKQDGSLAADAPRPNGWVTRETFVVEPAESAEPDRADAAQPAQPAWDGRLVLLRSTATGRYLATAGPPPQSPLKAVAADPAAAQRLRWHVVSDGDSAVAAAAAGGDVCVAVVGNDPLINGRETQDRCTLALPAAQERLVRAALAACPRLVLIVMSSYPYALPWADEHVPAIIWTCHGGQETGRAIGEVLLGSCDPAGRLAQTWYASDADLPDLLDYDIIASRRTYLYFHGQPLYPFGHGLSYTTFGYQNLRLTVHPAPAAAGQAAAAARSWAAQQDTLAVAVSLSNTGERPGTQVVQVYGRAVSARRPAPLRRLCGFAKAFLAPGETRTVTVRFPVSALACWDVARHEMTVDAGDYEIMVGSSSARIALTGVLTVRGVPPGPRQVIGSAVAAADFDDCGAITLVDVSRERGDAVTPAGTGRGWVMFRDADLRPFHAGQPDGRVVTLNVARQEPGEARVKVRLGDPDRGTLIGDVCVPSTGGRYQWTEVTAGLHGLAPDREPVQDLYLVLEGAVRLAWFRLDVTPGSPSPEPPG